MIREALVILLGCSDGATEHALKLHGVSVGAMAVMVRNGLARVEQQTVGVHGDTNFVFQVDRYWITPKGRRSLEAV